MNDPETISRFLRLVHGSVSFPQLQSAGAGLESGKVFETQMVQVPDREARRRPRNFRGGSSRFWLEFFRR